MALLNYNRSILTNFANSTAIVLTGIDQLILEFGLFVDQPLNFIELPNNDWLDSNGRQYFATRSTYY